jgi:hypothetical protein
VSNCDILGRLWFKVKIKLNIKKEVHFWMAGIVLSSDNPTQFLTNRIAAFFKFGPIKLIYSEKTPSRVKKQPAE